MNKQDADKYIFEYRDKIFGFALSKMRNIDQAQELASDIIYEVYLTFLRKDDIVNLDGYVYRIARNVWTQYIHKLETGRRFESIEGLNVPCEETVENMLSLEESEMLKTLRKEIGYLSHRQRLVIYMHYYDKLAVKEIAARLGISEGTVKWHLNDARTKLKVGMDMENKNMAREQNLEINPIRFINMGHGGVPGKTGDTYDMFDSRLKQNIAWSCYHEPKTLEEIARAVGVPRYFVEDHLEKLVEYAYIDRLDNSKHPKFRTNMLIDDARNISAKEEQAFYEEAADFLIENYFLKIFADFKEDPLHFGFVSDGGSYNFLKYNLVAAAITRLQFHDDTDAFEKYAVKRPDGGQFIAYATVTDDCMREQKKDSVKTGLSTDIWGPDDDPSKRRETTVMDCKFSDRAEGWRDNPTSDWESLERFRKKGREGLSVEEYKRLCDKGYLYEDVALPVFVETHVYTADRPAAMGRLLYHEMKRHIEVSEKVRAYAKDFDNRKYEWSRRQYPAHMEQTVKFLNQDCICAPLILPVLIGKMLHSGLLEPLSDAERKAVFAIVCVPAE